eukprot:COSAG04_NODE_669_length_11388_cov_7.882098_11_plen_196_part_01
MRQRGAHVDDPAAATAALEERQQALDQQEVPEVIGSHRQLDAVLRHHTARLHEASVAHEHVQTPAAGAALLERIAERADRAQRGQVQRDEWHALLPHPRAPHHIGSGGLRPGLRAAGQDHRRAHPCQLARSLQADAGVGPSHDAHLAAHVDVAEPGPPHMPAERAQAGRGHRRNDERLQRGLQRPRRGALRRRDGE